MTEKHATVKAHIWAAWDEPHPAVSKGASEGSPATVPPDDTRARAGDAPGDRTAAPAAPARGESVAAAPEEIGPPAPRAAATPSIGGTPSRPRGASTRPGAGTRAPVASTGRTSAEDSPAHPSTGESAAAVEASAAAETIRRRLASAWGEIGSSWGVPPATARVHGYLLAHRLPLSEREIRLALGLSHRATSLALAESASWGLIERVPEARRSGRRGPAGAAWVAVGDHWRWFGRVVEQRRMREGDPAVAAIARAAAEARDASMRAPDDPDLHDLSGWLDGFLGFVRLFDRAAALVARVPPADLERAVATLGVVPDEAALQMLRLLSAVPEDDLLALIRVLGRLSPGAAPRAVRLAARVVGGLAR
jgi:DNA-binding transcriptional regulator GbsR (MarR family)